MPYYALGLDLGQTTDRTALALIEYDYAQKPIYGLRGLHRFPLATPYTELAGALEHRLTNDPLRRRINLAIDATGVGAAVTDHFRERLPTIPLYAITITSGANITGNHQNPHVPKQDLISTTSVILEQRRLHIAANMRETEALVDELTAYRRTTTEHGNATYGAASGSHDDLLIALSLALWTAEYKYPPPRPYRSNIDTLRKTRLPSIEQMAAARHRRSFGW